MTINERFRIVINDFYSGNKRAFATAMGINPTVIENVVGSRGGNPSFEVIQKVLTANANINPDWLILENGPMLKDGFIQEVKKKVDSKPGGSSVKIIDNDQFNLLMDRYESLVIKNSDLEKKYEDLKHQVEKPCKSINYPISVENSTGSIAAEPLDKQ